LLVYFTYPPVLVPENTGVAIATTAGPDPGTGTGDAGGHVPGAMSERIEDTMRGLQETVF